MGPRRTIVWRSAFFAGERGNLGLRLFAGVDIDAGEQGAQPINSSAKASVFLPNITVGDTFNDDSEGLIVGEFATVSLAQPADKRPEVHRKVFVFHELLEEIGEIPVRSDVDAMHDADRLKLSDVHVEALRLLQAVCISRHAVTLDAKNVLSIALPFAMLIMRHRELDDLANSFFYREGPVSFPIPFDWGKKKLPLRITGNRGHSKHWQSSKFGSKFATCVHFVAVNKNI